MRGLLKNELIKIFKQTSYKVITIVAVALVLLGTLFNLSLTSLASFDVAPAEEAEFYRDQAEYFEDDDVQKGYYLDCVSTIEFFADENGNYDWKYDIYYLEYDELYLKARAYELIESGKYSEEDIEKSEYWYYISPEEDPALPELQKQLKELQTEIKDATFRSYIEREAKTVEMEMHEYELDIAQAKSDLAANPDNEKYAYNVELYGALLDSSKRVLSAYNYIIDKVDSPDDWRYKTVVALNNSTSDYYMSVIMPEKLYNNSMEAGYYMNYGEYVRNMELHQKESMSASEIFEYSLENSIPVSGIESNQKLMLRSNFTSVVGTLVILFVIVCGLTLSNEFSSGTIRLLVIRPKTRAKILTSKMLAALIYMLLLVAASLIIIFVFGILLGGVGDIFVSDLFYLGGNVVALPSFLMSLAIIFEGIITIMFFGAIALLLSVLTKKTALSIAIPIVLHSIGATAQSISLMIAGAFESALPVVSLLPTSYVDLSIFNMTSAEYYVSMYGDSLTDMLGASMYYSIASQMYPIYGVVCYLAFTAGAVALTYLAFKKTQIKN